MLSITNPPKWEYVGMTFSEDVVIYYIEDINKNENMSDEWIEDQADRGSNMVT